MSPTPDRLYGTPHAEVMYFDIDDVWTSEIDPTRTYGDDGPWVVEEWTVHHPRHHLPSMGDLLDHIQDLTADSGNLPEEADIDFFSDECKAAAEVLLDACAAALTWRMADRKVAEHVLVPDGDYFTIRAAE